MVGIASQKIRHQHIHCKFELFKIQFIQLKARQIHALVARNKLHKDWFVFFFFFEMHFTFIHVSLQAKVSWTMEQKPLFARCTFFHKQILARFILCGLWKCVSASNVSLFNSSLTCVLSNWNWFDFLIYFFFFFAYSVVSKLHRLIDFFKQQLSINSIKI